MNEHEQVIDVSWPAPGHCSDCGNGHPVGHEEFDYLPWDEAEAKGHPGMLVESSYDPYVHRRRLVFGRDDLAAILGLLSDVKIINVNLFREPLWVEVFVASERFPKHDDRLGGETRVEPVEFVQPVPGYGPGRMVHHPGQGEPVQHEVEFIPTWMEGWRLAIEWLREQSTGGPRFADEMETRLPE